MSGHPPTETEVTPSGIVINYWDGLGGEGNKKRRYNFEKDGVKVARPASTSTIVKHGPPNDNFSNSAARKTLAVACKLHDNLPLNPAEAERWLKKQELWWDQQRDQAGKRGTATHDVLEPLLGGNVVSLNKYREDLRGFMRGVMGWFAEFDPKTVVFRGRPMVEVMVASMVHGFCGRFDAHVRIGDLTYRIDLKTLEKFSYNWDGEKYPPYPENVKQLEGYEIAAVESGYPASDKRAVLRVTANGDFDFTESWGEPDDFLVCLESHKQHNDLARRQRAAARELGMAA